MSGVLQVWRGVARLPRPSLLAATLMAAAGSLAWLTLRYAFPFGPPILGWLLVPLTPLLAAIAARRVARGQTVPKAARQLWRSMMYSTVLIFCAGFTNAYHTLDEVGLAARRPDTTSFVLFIAAALITLWGVMRLPVRRRTRSEWLTVGLDIAIVLVAAGLIMSYAMRHSVLGQQYLWAIALTAAVGVVVAIKVSLTGFTGLDPAAMRMLAGTVLLGSLTGAVSPPADRLDLNQAMIAMPLVYAGMAYAAELQRRATPRRGAARRRPIPFSTLPYVAIGCTDALLLVADNAGHGNLDPLVTGSVVLTGIVIVRQVVIFCENRRYQDRLAYQATHDDLTGLANRALFIDRTEYALSGAPAGTVTVALIDLDDFKSINDRLGHVVGDRLLTALGARLRAAVRPGDTIARLGGDEFAVLVAGESSEYLAAIATRVLGLLADPISTGDHDLLVQASIGLADNAATSTAADLLRHADIAMYAAKARGRNRYAHFNADLDAQTVEHAQLAADLSHALDGNELRLLYQPIVELPTGRVVAVEALVRWHHPRHGLVSPDRFIPVAEQTGQIVPIGAWILATACRQAVTWDRNLGDRAPSRITVNVSARQLLDPEFPQDVLTVLSDTGLDPPRLTIEITETAVFGGGPTVDAVTAIRAAGVAIALDDFGTGHSSLGLLRTCPVDIVKVDKSFIDGIGGTLRDEAIATSVLHIAEALGLRTIAEGVETATQAARLYQLGYHYAQGFHFARPLSPDDVERLIDVSSRARATIG